eukprot:scaffold119172_cov57-Phaeocystis_antarctica.AAC.2
MLLAVEQQHYEHILTELAVPPAGAVRGSDACGIDPPGSTLRGWCHATRRRHEGRGGRGHGRVVAGSWTG